MLLSYFRKIDAYSGIRVFAAAVVAFAVLWSAGIASWQEVVLSFGLGALWLWLSWTLLRDRWVIKASALRFMTFLVLAVYWSVEFEISTLLFYVLVVELNWHLAEFHKRKGSVLSVLNSGTLTALASLWLPQEALYAMGTVLMIWLVSGGVKIKTVLQWLLAWFMIMVPLTYVVASEGVEHIAVVDAPLRWWALPMGLSVLAIFEWVQSYLKANQTNKSRAVVAGLFIIGGGFLGWWLGSYFGTAICILGLSYHLANGLRYFKRNRLAEALFLLVLTFVLISHYDVIPW
jgi:hypothetical protein